MEKIKFFFPVLWFLYSHHNNISIISNISNISNISQII